MVQHIREDTLQAYLDSELGYDEIRTVDRHIEECQSCQEELHAMENFIAAVAAAPDEPLGIDLTFNVMSSIANTPEEKGSLVPILFGEGVVAVLLLAGVLLFASAGIFQEIPEQILAIWSSFAGVEIPSLEANLSVWLGQSQNYLLSRAREVAAFELPSLTTVWLWLVVFIAAFFGLLANGVLLRIWGGRSRNVGVPKRYG